MSKAPMRVSKNEIAVCWQTEDGFFAIHAGNGEQSTEIYATADRALAAAARGKWLQEPIARCPYGHEASGGFGGCFPGSCGWR